MTKAQKGMVETYNRAYATTINQLYSKPSYAKQSAEEYCLRKCQEFKGYRIRFYSANTWQFSCGFMWNDGKHEHLHVETARNTYDFIIDE